jgi:hypothetical protein
MGKKTKLPAEPKLKLDQKTVNLLRYLDILTFEDRGGWSPIELKSVMEEIENIQSMITERIFWQFQNQFSRSHFDWGGLKTQSRLPDLMPKEAQFEARRYESMTGVDTLLD